MVNLGIQQFSDMVTEAGRLVDNTSTALKTSIKSWINTALSVAEVANDWDELLRTDESGLRDRADTAIKTFEASEAWAPMPWNAREITALFFQDSSVDPPDIVTQDELYRRAGSSLNTESRPRFAAMVGTTAQYKKLPASEVLKFKCPTSTNANLVARIHYILGAGHVGNEQWQDLSAADWTTATSMSAAAVLGWPITKIALPSTWADTFNGYRNDGTTEIISIERAEAPLTATNGTQAIASRPLMRLWPVPEQDYAMTIGFRIFHPKLVEDADTPMIPVSQFLVSKAAAQAARQLGDHKRASSLDTEARLALNAISRKSKPAARQFAVPFRGDFLGQSGVR